MLSVFNPCICISTEANESNYQSYERFASRLDISIINFSVSNDSTITKFEKGNNLIVNFYSEEGDTVVQIRISPNIDDVNTLFLNDTKDVAITKDNIQEYTKQLLDLNTKTRLVNLFLFNKHYSQISNLNRLVSSQISTKETQNHICNRFLSSYKSPLKYYHHLQFSVKNKATKAVTRQVRVEFQVN